MQISKRTQPARVDRRRAATVAAAAKIQTSSLEPI
jgi:hypothetical protein